MKYFPLVSVIIPFYNRFDLLEHTLMSVRKQDYKNFEIILVDDGSEEKLKLEIIESILDESPFILKRLKKNSGPGLARSYGRQIASGKYIAYLDSDDLWEGQFISKTVEKLEENPNLSMVFTNVLIKRGKKENRRLDIKEGIYDFYDLIFHQKIYWATAAALWRKEVSSTANWKPFRDHEDYVHDILSLKHNPNIYHICEPLCIVNKNVHTGIRRSNKDMLKSFLVLIKDETLMNQLKDKGEHERFLSFLLWRISKRKITFDEFLHINHIYLKIYSISKNKKNIIDHYLKICYRYRFYAKKKFYDL